MYTMFFLKTIVGALQPYGTYAWLRKLSGLVCVAVIWSRIATGCGYTTRFSLPYPAAATLVEYHGRERGVGDRDGVGLIRFG